MKKIYFGCSIAGGRDHAHMYADIVNYIKSSGGKVLSELFADPSLVSEVGTNPDFTPGFIWQRDVNWVKEADGLIMEVTQPSLGVGYEIALAEGLKKPVLALFHAPSGRRLSPMILGNPQVLVHEYNATENIQPVIRAFIDKL